MTPLTCNATAVLVVFVTVAVNGWVLVVTTEATAGEIEIVTAGGSCLTELDAQPCRKKIKIKGRMKKNGTGRSSSER